MSVNVFILGHMTESKLKARYYPARPGFQYTRKYIIWVSIYP